MRQLDYSTISSRILKEAKSALWQFQQHGTRFEIGRSRRRNESRKNLRQRRGKGERLPTAKRSAEKEADIVDREKPTIRQLVQRLAGVRSH